MTSRRSIALSLFASLALAACPGRITDPSPFIGPTGEGGVMGCSIPSSQIETQLIRPRCATQGCHDRGDRAGGLDLRASSTSAAIVWVSRSSTRPTAR